jgi:hypothetical protein
MGLAQLFGDDHVGNQVADHLIVAIVEYLFSRGIKGDDLILSFGL